MPRGYLDVKSELLFCSFLFLHVHTSGFGDRLDRGVRRSLVTAEETCGQAAQGGAGRQVELFYQIDILGEDTHLYTGGTYTLIQGRGH